MCKHRAVYLGRLMEALHEFLVVQEFILISLSAGQQELRLRLGVVFVALHGLVEVPLGDDTCQELEHLNFTINQNVAREEEGALPFPSGSYSLKASEEVRSFSLRNMSKNLRIISTLLEDSTNMSTICFPMVPLTTLPVKRGSLASAANI